MKHLSLLILVLCLAACTPGAMVKPTPTPNPTPTSATTSTGAQTSTSASTQPSLSAQLLADLDAAKTIACTPVNGGTAGQVVDPLACNCYPVLEATLQGITPAGSPGIVGPISGFEAGRIAVNNLVGGIPLPVQAACGGLVVDVNAKALTLGGLIGILVPK